MSDIMRPIPFAQLLDWTITEYRDKGSIFGVRKLLPYTQGKSLPIFEEKLEAPFGPAAGPNTQLAQNIIAAYVAGARFFELKTVQVMDGRELAACVNKPCILAADEGYNCEWSTELTVQEAFEEYVKAWVVCRILAKELSLGDPDGFVFNMSVGYDLAGIKTPKIDAFIEGMKDASDTDIWKECIEDAAAACPLFAHVDEAYIRAIPPVISRSITESTLHGCPPDEIERIATYLMKEKGLHTFIKCNPTLLGYEFARGRLDALGFDYVSFDEHHFVEDLQWEDAEPMFRRLIELGREKDLTFGVKLTNTFPAEVKAGELPAEEMYMSGRALYPLTIALSKRIAEAFGGKLRISYSGGADIHNTGALFRAGIWPVTMATNILKPGGYERLAQIGKALCSMEYRPFETIDVQAVIRMEEAVLEDPLYKKPVKPLPERHMKKSLPLFDCFTSPCRDGCPIGQDIPGYLEKMAQGAPAQALEIILDKNPLPFITGTICPHHCADKCMRSYYEAPLQIRRTKLEAAESACGAVLPSLKAKDKVPGKQVAVVGAGPAGLAAAFLLSRAGIGVTVFEKRREIGGVVRHAIPSFRIPDAAIDRDIEICSAFGARFVTGKEITDVRALFNEGFTDVILAAGAWRAADAGMKYGGARDALEFLAAAKQAEKTGDYSALDTGSDVVVIGGGNTAMDTARAAMRIPGVKHVRLVYRRTKRYMPADEEELDLALRDGVEFLELLAPVGARDGVLTCDVMRLGAPDASGRRSPEKTGETRKIPATCVITATGEQIDGALFAAIGAGTDEKNRPVVTADMRTEIPHVYAAGDMRRGPATVVEAIADATAAANAILREAMGDAASVTSLTPEVNVRDDAAACCREKGNIAADPCAMPDERCLGCPSVCEVCADVCPNRANVAIRVPGGRMPQILHMDGMCNECGNCAVFCPYDGRPYRDKFTLFWSREDFDDSENEGFFVLSDDRILVRLDGEVFEIGLGDADRRIPPEAAALIRAVCSEYAYLLPPGAGEAKMH